MNGYVFAFRMIVARSGALTKGTVSGSSEPSSESLSSPPPVARGMSVVTWAR